MDRERIVVSAPGGRGGSGIGRGTNRAPSAGRGRGSTLERGIDVDALQSKFNPLAMLAQLPDDTPEVSQDSEEDKAVTPLKGWILFVCLLF
jgi:hypothetical protein